MNRFSIRDIENLTGIKAHTIRIWEQRYGILQPKRTPTNIRYYDADDLKLALKVALLNDYGYKISRIHQMQEEEMASLIDKIADKEFRLQVLSNDLLEAALAMDMIGFEQLLNNYIHKNGIEQAVEQLIFLFLEKVGLMWLTDHLLPAQEHLVSNVIYRKLALAIEQLPFPVNGSEQACVLLFLPEGEIHDIGLMYVFYLLRKSGKNAVYLGPNTPLSDAIHVYNTLKPQSIYMHLTSAAGEFDCGKYIQRVAQEFANARIYISGSMLRNKKYAPAANTRFLHSLQEVRDTIIHI
ncbi:MerR family transcriptional regulator [Chitinophagaceae bacterium MMS25-I14]